MSRYSRPANSSLFVRNVHRDVRVDELRIVFERYGAVKDVYIPLDFHTRQPRGFAYIQYDDWRDAQEAVVELDRCRVRGAELDVQFAEGDRKTPGEMRNKGDSRTGSRSPSHSRGRERQKSRHRSRSNEITRREYHQPSRKFHGEEKRLNSRSNHGEYRPDSSSRRRMSRSRSKKRNRSPHSPFIYRHR